MKVAVLVANGFEQAEFTEPIKVLRHAGALVTIISPEEKMVKGWQHDHWGDSFPVDVALNKAQPEDYDALVLPGGVMNPDRLRLFPHAIEFIQKIYAADKPIAAICHGPWPLIDAGVVSGLLVTSWPSLRRDLINAGAEWVDKEAVTDGLLLTSRNPGDIPAFNKAMLALFQARSSDRVTGR